MAYLRRRGTGETEVGIGSPGLTVHDFGSHLAVGSGGVRDESPPTALGGQTALALRGGSRRIQHGQVSVRRFDGTALCQSLEPWYEVGRCVSAEALHIQPETVQHRRAGGLHYVLTAMSNPLPLLAQLIDEATVV